VAWKTEELGVQLPVGARDIYLFFTMSRSTLGYTQPSYTLMTPLVWLIDFKGITLLSEWGTTVSFEM
jgi:hypothetical protein